MCVYVTNWRDVGREMAVAMVEMVGGVILEVAEWVLEGTMEWLVGQLWER